MIREIDGLEFVNREFPKNLLPKEASGLFLSYFTDKRITSSDRFPEIMLMNYSNQDKTVEECFLSSNVIDIAIQWMPFGEYREGTVEEDRCLDQENAHCYQLHLLLYYEKKEDLKFKMVKEWQNLVPSYKEKEENDKIAFLSELDKLLEAYSSYRFLGYRFDFSDCQ